jgi:prevent-host-death family protein
MKTASITHAKNHFSTLIDRVRRGQSILITDRNRPVARLEPVSSLEQADRGKLQRLERAGVITRPRKKITDAFLKRPRPTGDGRRSLLQAVLDERAEGR